MRRQEADACPDFHCDVSRCKDGRQASHFVLLIISGQNAFRGVLAKIPTEPKYDAGNLGDCACQSQLKGNRF